MRANKQTAVEWLSQELDEFLFLFDDDWQQLNTMIEAAKQMEKEQLEVLKDFDTWKEWKNETK